MGQLGNGRVGVGDRKPWHWLALLAVCGVLASWVLVSQASAQVDRSDDALETQARLAVGAVVAQLDRFLGGAVELASAGAGIFGGVHGNVPLAHRLAKGLFEGRRSSTIYGVGAFYAPYAFLPRSRLFGIYYERDPHGGIMSYVTVDRLYWATDAHGRITYFRTVPREADYTTQRWYRRARSTRRVAVIGPYSESGKSFVSVVRAFYRDGRFAGVFSVDALSATMLHLLRQPLEHGAVAYVASRNGRVLLASGRLPVRRDRFLDSWRVVPHTRATVHVLLDEAAVRAANAAVVSWAIALGAGLWILLGLLAVALLHNATSRRRTFALELARTRLESELAIGKEVEDELRRVAQTDALTGLPNRTAFIERSAALLAGPKREREAAVLFVDLDRFNMVNDTLGHLAGDELLKLIASRLREAMPEGTTVFRLGGDEFVILCQSTQSPAGIASRVLSALQDPMLLGGRIVYIGASVGIVAIDASYCSPEELLRDADIAMYAAKERGRGQYVLFDAPMRRRVLAESEIENDLRRAIERREFVPYYQPIVEISSARVVAFEALARWDRAGHGIIAARDFVPYAESRGLIDEIDDRMLTQATSDAVAIGARFSGSAVAVNISARRLCTGDLMADVSAALEAAALAPTSLHLEITETAVMTDPDHARATLTRLRDAGVQIVLDDFGAGYSSLAYLHRLPIGGVKIDGSFVSSIQSDEGAVAIVRSVVALAETLGLYTVAEGVETQEQLEIVARLGVRYAQGFFFSPALALPSLQPPILRSQDRGA